MAFRFGYKLGLSPGGGGFAIPTDPAYPVYTATRLATLRTKAGIQGSGSRSDLSDVAATEMGYGSTAVQIVIDSTTTRTNAPTGTVSPVDCRNGVIRFTTKPLLGLPQGSSSTLNVLEMRLYSSGSPASPPTAYHTSGSNPGTFRGRSTSKDATTAGRKQYFGWPSNQFSASGGGADMSAITWAAVLTRTSSGTVTIYLGDIDFVPNPRNKAVCFISLDDGYLSQYSYAYPKLAAYGFPATLYPGAAQTTIDAWATNPNAMSIAQCAELLAAGWQLGSQAWSTESAATFIDSMTDPQRQADVDALRNWQNTKFRHRQDGADGSYFSGVGTTRMEVFALWQANYRTMRAFGAGNAASPPIPGGESFPPADPYAIISLDAETSYPYLQGHVDQAIANKGLASFTWHNFTTGSGSEAAVKAAFENLLAYLDANRDYIDVMTPKEAFGGVGSIYADNVVYNKGSYIAYMSPWSIFIPPNDQLVHGVDYEDTVEVIPHLFPNSTKIKWRWPNSAPVNAGVRGYMALSYGNYDGGAPEVPVTPVQVKNIGTFGSNINFTMSGTTTEANVLHEFYLTSAAGNASAKLFEIGFFLHAMQHDIDFMNASTSLGTYTDVIGRGWTIAKSSGAVPFIMFRPTDNLDYTGKLDIREFLRKLIVLGQITGDEWINGGGFGSEVNRSSGELDIWTWRTKLATNPVQTNYITQQDLTNAYWTKTNLTAPAADKVMETAATGQHSIINASAITRAAGVKTFVASIDAERIAGSNYLLIQVFDGSFASSAMAYFDLVNNKAIFKSAGGAWTNAQMSIDEVVGTNKWRCRLEWTTDASTTDLYVFPQLQPDQSTNSYLGNIANGMKLDNLWVYNKNAAAGGS